MKEIILVSMTGSGEPLERGSRIRNSLGFTLKGLAASCELAQERVSFQLLRVQVLQSQEMDSSNNRNMCGKGGGTTAGKYSLPS